MADFGMLTPTAQGISAQLKALNGETLTFSKIKMGDGTFVGNLANLTDLISTKVELPITDKYIKNGMFMVDSFFSNEKLKEGFYWKEIGLFMRGENGKDILYSYSYAGSNYDYIPATEDTRYSKHIKVGTAVRSAANVSIIESESIVYVNRYEFEAVCQELLSKIANAAQDSEFITSVLYASKWDKSTKTYSFEDGYPFEDYDIKVYPSNTCTDEQIDALNEAFFTGSISKNELTALKEVPTIDIPVYLEIIPKKEQEEQTEEGISLLKLGFLDKGYYVEIEDEDKDENVQNIVSKNEDLTDKNFKVDMI